MPPRKALRILVTGGLGYAGGWISQGMARARHELFVLSSRPAATRQAFPYTHISADLERLDAEDIAALLPDALDAVVHAASLNEAFLPDYPRRSLLVNALGTRNLLEALELKARPGAVNPGPPPLFIYCSTFHVYGQSAGRISEATPPLPTGDYALTHYFAEEYCRAAMRGRGTPCIILRLTNGYGAPQTPVNGKWHLLVNDLCRAAVSQGVIRLRSNPAVMRDFVWLGDMAEVCQALIGRRDLAGRLFNVASGKSLAIGEIAGRIASAAEKELGKKVPVVFEREAEAGGEALEVSNHALRDALGLPFHDKLEHEAAAIVRMLSGGALLSC